mmetsp:Transcript_7274/g.10708  ORF Transcript_7274/g.10708 Transcript_7274/m.10708 type:complete len:266 (+) Transcript_7274:3355-4152(+)
MFLVFCVLFIACFFLANALVAYIPYGDLGYTKEDFVGKLVNYAHDVVVVYWIYQLWRYGRLFDALVASNQKGSIFVYTHDTRIDMLASFTLAYVLVDLVYVLFVEGIEHQQAYVLFHSMIAVSFSLYLWQQTGGVAVAVAMFTEIASIFEHNQTWIDSLTTIIFQRFRDSKKVRAVAYRLSQFHLIAAFFAFLCTRTLITLILWSVMVFYDASFLMDHPIVVLQAIMMTLAMLMNTWFGFIRYHEFMRDVSLYQSRILRLYASSL